MNVALGAADWSIARAWFRQVGAEQSQECRGAATRGARGGINVLSREREQYGRSGISLDCRRSLMDWPTWARQSKEGPAGGPLSGQERPNVSGP